MNKIREKIAFLLYKSLSKLISHGRSTEQLHKFQANTKLNLSAKILPEAIIDNLSNNSDLISIDANSVIRGQLLVFAHAGRIEIGKNCYLGECSRVWSAASIKIGDRVLISHNVNIHDTDSHPIDPVMRHQHYMEIMSFGHPSKDPGIISEPIVIEDDVWIGLNSVILKGVRIGQSAIVGAGSVVTKDVPSHSIVAGNPAKVIHTL